MTDWGACGVEGSMNPDLRLHLRRRVAWPAFWFCVQISACLLRAAPADAAADPLVLNPFSVTGAAVGPYQAAETTSGSRVRLELFEATKSIGVVTAQLMDDLGAVSPLNALKYFPGIARGTQPEGTVNERLTLRGFEVLNTVMDGLISSGGNFNKNQYSAFTERIEVVMGTDSILSPSGVPGGTINFVTKKPRFADFGSVKAQFGEHNAGQIDLDVNRTLTPQLAIRVGASLIDRQVYGVGAQKGFGSLVQGSWRFPNRSVATLQFMFDSGDAKLPVGVPIDPSIGTLSRGAVVLRGLAPDAGERLHRDTFLRSNHRLLTFFYDGNLTPALATRIAARADTYGRLQLTPTLIPAGGLGGAYDPRTGNFVPGVLYGAAPAFNPSPAPQPNERYTSSNNYPQEKSRSLAVQNDYALRFETPHLRFQTLAGVAAEKSKSDSTRSNVPSPAFDIFREYVAIDMSRATFLDSSQGESESVNLYVNQSVKALSGDRLVGTAGLAKNWNRRYTLNSALLNLYPKGYSSRPNPLFANFGLVFKAQPDLALYFGHSESATPQNNRPDSVPYIDRSTAEQDEAGVRLRFFGGKGTATVAYYHIKQDNLPLINPLNLTLPPPVPALPSLLLNRIAKGWEFSVNAAVSEELSVLMSWTDFTNHDPNGLPVRGTAEKSGAGWVRYERKHGPLKGLGLGIGYVWQGRVVGDVASGYTQASTPTNPIPNQPRFWLAANGVLNVSASYRVRGWTIRAFIDNVLDKDHIASSLSRQGVYPGTPFNLRGAIDWSF